MTFEFSITCKDNIFEDVGCTFTEESVSRLKTASSYIILVMLMSYLFQIISLMYLFFCIPYPYLTRSCSCVFFQPEHLLILINSKMVRAVSIATRLIQSTTFVKMKRVEIASLGHLFFHSNQGMKLNRVPSQISLSSLSQRRG